MPLFLLLLLAADPFAGTWQLNVAKSTWASGHAPKAQVIQMEETKAGIAYSSETTNTDGSKTTSHYTAKYDGKEVFVVGNVYWDPVSLKRLDPHTVVATYSKRGKVSAVAKRTVSADGKTLTITTEGKNRAGKAFVNTSVYDRK